MTGLEIPAFIIGLSGLLSVFEKTCEIWRSVSSAQGFGQDIARSMDKIEIEFHRFETWWTVLETLANKRKEPRNQTSISPLIVSTENEISIAARNIRDLLEEVEKILRDNKALAVVVQHRQKTLSSTEQSKSSGSEAVQASRDRQRHLERELIKKSALDHTSS